MREREGDKERIGRGREGGRGGGRGGERERENQLIIGCCYFQTSEAGPSGAEEVNSEEEGPEDEEEEDVNCVHFSIS